MYKSILFSILTLTNIAICEVNPGRKLDSIKVKNIVINKSFALENDKNIVVFVAKRPITHLEAEAHTKALKTSGGELAFCKVYFKNKAVGDSYLDPKKLPTALEVTKAETKVGLTKFEVNGSNIVSLGCTKITTDPFNAHVLTVAEFKDAVGDYIDLEAVDGNLIDP